MSVHTKDLDEARARLARAHLRVKRSPDDKAALAEMSTARRAYAALKIEKAIRDGLDEWPGLTAGQRSTLAAILTGAGGQR